MRKTIAIFLSFFALNSTAFAQRTIEILPFDPDKLNADYQHRSTFEEPHTPLAIAQRCIRQANYIDGTLYDSVTFYYSGTRGTGALKDNLEPRNSSDSIYRLDTATGAFYLGASIQYDLQDRLVSGSYYSRTPPHVFIGKDTARYHANGVRTFYETDIDDLNFVKQYSLSLNNDAGKILKDTFCQITYGGNSSNWTTSNNYAYDGNNRKTFHANYYAYNNFTNSNLVVTKSFYNGNNSLPYLDSVSTIINGNLNSLSQRATYHFYNNNQQLLADTTYNQNGTLNSVINYTYTGNTVTSTTRSYNNGNWNSLYRTITQKNNEGLQTHYEFQSWNSSSNTWVINNGDSSTYNNDGYVIATTSYLSNNNTIIVSAQLTTARNSFNNPVANVYKRYNLQGVLTSDTRGFYYYTEYDNGTGIRSNKRLLNVAVFPNPTNNRLEIKVGDYTQKLNLKLFDINGKAVINRSFSQQDIVYLDGLANGVYQLVLMAQDNSAYFTQQIVKQ